ncbi:hypothetical protein BJ165DRAFT_325023 [Panaeolus papilionaceus]|nr:hypothetical protein BJ165DRAFT_325023 [Panaeolus papilionaceus]
MPLPQSTATSTATKLRDLISSTLNLLTYSQDSDQEESEKETIAQYKGYLMAVYRIRDHVYLLVKDSILTSEAAKSLLEILETMELNLERHLANMSKEDLQVATGEELRKSLQETYEIIADKSGTTVNRLIMKVKEMILATGYNYVIKDGEITM